jgi:hypothetical protein
MKLLSKDQIIPALLSWIHLSSYGGPLPAAVTRSLGWLRLVWEQGYDFLPLDLTCDLGHLLLLGDRFPFGSTMYLGQWDDHEKERRFYFEDKVLAKWVIDPSLLQAHTALAEFPDSIKDRAIAHAIVLALGTSTTDRDSFWTGNSAHLRSKEKDIEQAFQEWPSSWSERQEALDPNWISWAWSCRSQWEQSLPQGRLFTEEDLWEIEHFQKLPQESTRLVLRELHALVARIGELPYGKTLSLQRQSQQVPTEQVTADDYPAGGFDSLATRGRFENLVRSEIMYVGEGTDGEGSFDLFDMRYAQNELLYYKRDESPMHDRFRILSVVIDRPADLRNKLPNLPAQTLLLIEALVMRLFHDLSAIVGPHAFRTVLDYRNQNDQDHHVFAEESDILSLSLAAAIVLGRMQLTEFTDWSELQQGKWFVFSSNPPIVHPHIKVWVRVGDACWMVGTESFEVNNPQQIRLFADWLLEQFFR